MGSLLMSKREIYIQRNPRIDNKMKSKIYLMIYILFLLIVYGCKGPKLENRYFVSDGINIPLASDDTLKQWQQRVVEQGDADAFSDLTLYYDDDINLNRKQELIPYILIMAERYDNTDAYLLYYNYIVESDSVDKNIIKAVTYLKVAAQSKTPLVSELARSELAALYREGKYFIKKDTIIADYLERGGQNIDSILLVKGRQ